MSGLIVQNWRHLATQMRRLRTWLPPMLVCGLLFVLTGCQALEDMNEVRWTVSFHLKARPGDGENLSVFKVRNLEDDQTLLIRRLPLSSSRHILFGEPVVENGRTVAIKFTMDPHQRFKWLQITTEYGGRQVAVCVDGYYRFMWRVPYKYDQTTHQVVVRGPWEPREAELICEWAPTNYKRLRNDPVDVR